MGRRRATVFLGMDRIARMLALPDGLRALAVRDDWQRNGALVLVEGDSLPETDPAAVLPDLPFQLLDRTELAMGATLRAEWTPDGAELSAVCPVDPCTWSLDWTHEGVTLAKAADSVQRHLTLDHGVR